MQDEIEDTKRFASLITALADYYGQKISAGIMGLYWEGLRQYDYEAIERAAWAHTQSPDESGRWMPKISDLTKALQGRTIDQASLAWAKVDKAVRTIGTWRDVVFDDPIIHRVIQDMGGWIKLGEQDLKEWPFIEKRFVMAYQGHRIRFEAMGYPKLLTGIANAQNGFEGKEKQPPTLIGDQEKATQILLSGSYENNESSKLIKDSIKKLEIGINYKRGEK